jgi:WD40 repeat protein/uncharacterized protein YegL
MKYCLYIIVALLIFSNSTAQKLTVFGTNSTNYPAVQAAVYAADAQGNRLNNLTPANVTVTENGAPRRILSITCPPDGTPARISAVLVVDISGSMNGQNMVIAKAAARSWIKDFPKDGSECAVTSFDNSSYINQDFTTDRTKLNDAVTALTPNGGTNYNAGFINGAGAAFEVLQRAKHKRVVVFLTDGQGTITEQDVLDKANAVNAVVYCVGVNLKLPDALKNIAEQTRGGWFENVNSEASIEEVYSRILGLAVSGPPCEITWETNVSCLATRTATISCPSLPAQATTEYTVLPLNLPNVQLSTFSARFPDIPPGTSDYQDVTVTAVTDSIVITSIVLSNTDFTIENAPAPVWNLNKGESKTFRVRFTPTDSSLTFADIRVLGNMCSSTTMYALGGYSSYRKPSARLQVSAPNGGERFGVGDTTTLRWTGLLPIDTVRLEYSVDAGVNWLPIAEKAWGLEYLWTVPNTPSNRCLLRATQYRKPTIDSVKTLAHSGGRVTGVCFHPDGTRAATIASGGELRIWNAESGTMLVPSKSLTSNVGNCIDWSPDGQRIAVGGNRIEFFNGDSFDFVQRLDSGTITSCAFSDDGLYLATENSSRNKIGLLSMQTQNIAQFSSGHTGPVNHLSLVRGTTKEFQLLTGSTDRTARRSSVKVTLDDITNGLQVTNSSALDFMSSDICVAYLANPTDTGSACAAFQNGDLMLYPSKAVLRPFGGDAVNEADWSPDGKSIAFAMNSGVLAIYDVASKTITRRLDTIRKSAISIRWDATSSKVIAGYQNSVAVIWKIFEQIDQRDTSDNVWEITTPTLSAAKNIDLGTVTLNSSHDSVVQAILCISQNPLSISRLDTAVILNDPDGAFRIVSGVPAEFPSGLPACIAVEVGFTPKKLGLATATLRLYSNGQTFDVLLIGIGIDREIAFPELVINFGMVPVGIAKDTLVDPSTTNTAIRPLTITRTTIAGPDIKQFVVIGGDTTITLASQESSKLLLRYVPRAIGRTSSRVKIEFTREGMQPTPGSPIYLHLIGEGICGIDSSRVMNVGLGKEIPAIVGAFISVPVVLSPQAAQSRDILSQKVYCRFSFDATMLFPLEPMPVGTLEGSRRTVTYEADRILSSDTLLLLPMLTMLGTDSMVTVRIDSLYFDDGGCPLKIEADSVTVKFIDLCTAGGTTRLLAGSPVTNVTLHPNPANDHPTILLTLAEDSPVTLTMLNALGQEVEVMNEQYGRGSHRIAMDATDIPAGMYSLRLVTRSEVKVVQFIKW